MNLAIWLFCILLLFNLFYFSTSIDSITSTNIIKDGDVMVSRRKIFALGFFSPGNSTKRYVGIWYNQISEQTIVWVANRDNPVYGKSGVVSINNHGDIVLSTRNRTDLVWTTSIHRGSRNNNNTNNMAQLLDTGNLVLFQNDAKKMLLWQSFDYPTNTLLPFMKLGLDRGTGLNRVLTSWVSRDDPGSGNYSYRFDPSGLPQLFLYKSSVKWWRTGSWTGQRLSGVPEMTSNYIFSITYLDNKDELSIMYSINNPVVLSRMVSNESGFQQRYTWNKDNHRWIGFWSAPKEQCDYYGHCGINSNCNPYHEDVFECTCLPGYEPKNPQEWYLRDGSSGCTRNQEKSMCQGGEGFVRVTHVKIPDTSTTHVDMGLELKACEAKCIGNCSCMAYTSAYYEKNGGVGCLMYHGDLIDTRTYTNAGQDLYVRVDAVELAKYSEKGSLGKKAIVGIAVASFVVMLLMTIFMCWLVRKKRAEEAAKSKFPFELSTSSAFLDDSFGRKDQDELPLFGFKTIAAATDNFSDDNKLGEGGFGSVYKGIFYNGKEIAVKRLAKCSGQGIEEFRNEVTLIAKLQHRNLVRILGCCVEAGEKMLIYEFLPNKSLDNFIFREKAKPLLDWRKRFDIICGIARGILYLHQDSRLKIIHRDLKASNVLLDNEMNPKIADFGMARIFGRDQTEANTNRVVGTYGYMSPEYAMEGQFSIKSDVYSFGILLLEIITGKKNSAFYLEDDASSNLVGHVWDLWKEGRAMEIVDESLGETHSTVEISRCIEIGLLCVQEYTTDRPTMASVVNMLSTIDSALPSPKKPAFIGKRSRSNHGDNSNTGASEEASSINEVTMTMFYGR